MWTHTPAWWEVVECAENRATAWSDSLLWLHQTRQVGSGANQSHWTAFGRYIFSWTSRVTMHPKGELNIPTATWFTTMFPCPVTFWSHHCLSRKTTAYKQKQHGLACCVTSTGSPRLYGEKSKRILYQSLLSMMVCDRPVFICSLSMRNCWLSDKQYISV